MINILLISFGGSGRCEHVVKGLTRVGYKVVLAPDMADGIEKIRTARFNAVILHGIGKPVNLSEIIGFITGSAPGLPIVLLGPAPQLGKEFEKFVDRCADNLPDMLFCVERKLDQAGDRLENVEEMGAFQAGAERERQWRRRRASMAKKRLSQYFFEIAR